MLSEEATETMSTLASKLGQLMGNILDHPHSIASQASSFPDSIGRYPSCCSRSKAGGSLSWQGQPD